MPRPPLWFTPCVLACTFDASGQGEAPKADSAEGATQGGSQGPSSSSGAPSTSIASSGSIGGTQSTGEAALTDATSSSGPADPSSTAGTSTEPPGTTSTSTSTSTSTNGPDLCDGMFVKQIELVANALVEAPMTTIMSESGEGLVALSGVAELGTVTFTFDLPCPGTYWVWGRVLDMWPDVHDDYDPDSFYVEADGGPEGGWFYGCQTPDKPGYRWLRIRPGVEGAPCDSFQPWVLDLTAGVHTIRLRNREWESGGRYAVVARVLLVNDPDYLPTMAD